MRRISVTTQQSGLAESRIDRNVSPPSFDVDKRSNDHSKYQNHQTHSKDYDGPICRRKKRFRLLSQRGNRLFRKFNVDGRKITQPKCETWERGMNVRLEDASVTKLDGGQ